MNLANNTILVTGATRGIGRELTRQLIAHGARVVAVARDRDRLAALTHEHGDHISGWVVDLTDPQAVDGFVSRVIERHPGLSVVINNAGVQTLTDFFDEQPQALQPVLRREVAVNLDAVIALSTCMLPHLRRQPSAAIVNITTGLALAPKRSAPVYCATKAGVRAFTRALRYQCRHSAPHIRVLEVVMALVDTDMTHGRGRGKISASAAATAVIDGLGRGRDEIYVGKVKLLRTLMRLSPALGYRILRDS
ncbi:SDR family oxidoreductase [Allorhizocola rhizosphaerae]|uniref:SDR family oxidoreductase n=1 Tax=Allorhizocola rhizosphaerae TaxID=1872709 RepID=UPI000E3DA104|nr:SDR family NAD(P)-dependent oxidoreductase [Allorhizocola rhizosphaerae]